jgi:hypothetical protein
MQPTENSKVGESLLLSNKVGGSMNVGLLSENHHKVNFIASQDLLLSEGVVLLM